jgi:hypothetical protein
MRRELLITALTGCLMATGLAHTSAVAETMIVAKRPWTGVIGQEKRLQLAEFAAGVPNLTPDTVKKRLSGVHVFECRNVRITALIVGAPDIVVTAAHAWIDRSGYRKPTTACGLIVHQDGYTRMHPIKVNSVVTGDFRYGPIEINSPHDWAVMRLQTPVQGVEPLGLPPEDWSGPLDNQPIVLATGPQTNFPIQSNATRLAENCTIRRVIDNGRAPALIKTDCDTGTGASGGAYLANLLSGRPVLVGLQSANRGEMGCEDFDEKRCFALGVPITGKLREAIAKKIADTYTTSAER